MAFLAYPPSLAADASQFVSGANPPTYAVPVGQGGFTVKSKTANYTTAAFEHVLCDSSGGTFTVTLPAATGTGCRIRIQKTDTGGNPVSVARAGSDTIYGLTSGGMTSFSVRGEGDCYELVDGASASWYVLEKYLAQSYCSVYQSVAQTISGSSAANLTFDAENEDVDGLHSTSSNTDRITIKRSGKYQINGSFLLDNETTDGYYVLGIQVNGTTVMAQAPSGTANTGTRGYSGLSVSVTLELVAGDIVTLNVSSGNSGSITTYVATGKYVALQVARIANRNAPVDEADRWLMNVNPIPALLSGTGTGEDNLLSEANLINPTETGGNWAILARGGVATNQIFLWTCPSGSDPMTPGNWTDQGSVFSTSGAGPAQFKIMPGGKVGGFYWAIYRDQGRSVTAQHLRWAKSSNLTSWSDAGQAIAPNNGNGAWWWNGGSPISGNNTVWVDSGGTVNCMFDAYHTASSRWRVGYATGASLGGALTETTNAPITSYTDAGNLTPVGGLMRIAVSGSDHFWGFSLPGATGIPSEVWHMIPSGGLTTLVAACARPVLRILSTNSGLATPNQTADPCPNQYNGSSYLLFEAYDNPNTKAKLCLAKYAGTLAQVGA